MAKKRTTDDTPDTPHEAGVHVITIQKLPFSYHAPYSEGHTLNSAEASALNQLLGENLRNNFAGKVKVAKEAEGGLTPEIESTLRAEFAEYASAYAFGTVKRRASTPSDPVENEARKIAKSMIVAHLQKAGKDPKHFKEVMDDKVTQLLDRDASIRAEARRRHETTLAIASANIEGLMEAAE